MPKVVWPRQVTVQIAEIVAYIRKDDPVAAEHIASRLIALGESLADFPYRGRPAPKGTREMTTVWPYILRYRIDAGVVTIMRVRHGARRSSD